MVPNPAKIPVIRKLEAQNVLQELPPVSSNYRETDYWHFKVLKPEALPPDLREEYNRLGEVRY